MNRSGCHLRETRAKRDAGGFLVALGRDTTGATLAMLAAFMLPLALMVGSAVDTSRLYLVKVRLQQACDAGVLAGRKLMTVTSGTTLDPTSDSTKPAETAAKAFFENNFPDGWMTTTGRSFDVSRTSDGQVAGSASVTVPMAIMGFVAGPQTQTATCNARLDIGDSDIMLVLDVTGSMGCNTGTGCSSTANWTRADGTPGYQIVEQSSSKIAALRSAVKLFRTTLETDKPAAAHIRYGFVPYSTSVNVGALIRAKGIENSADYLVDSAEYPSRELASDTNSSNLPTSANSANYSVTVGSYYQGDVIYGSTPGGVTVAAATAPNKQACLNQETRKSGTTNYPLGTFPTSGTVTRKFPVWTSSTCKTYDRTVKPYWRYTNVTRNVSQFKTFASTIDPTKITGASTQWQGCIQERDSIVSTTTTSYDIADLPKDMDPDFVPNSAATRWRPLWPSVVYYRPGVADSYNYNGTTSSSSDTTSSSAAVSYTALLENATGGSLGPLYQYYACSAPATRLAEMSASQFDNYLGTATTGDFRPFGHTLHDVGMIWGLRLLSPNGLWASDTAAWPGNNPPNRYIVLMTDGLMDPDPNAYSMYGMNKLQTHQAAAGTSDTNLATIHEARLQAECDAAQAKNITVFVVAFDTGGVVPANLQSCASPGYAYAATTQTALENAFKTIALQIARLRLSA